MTEVCADRCNGCGKVVVKDHRSSSSDMVRTYDYFLYLCDTQPGESRRPTLHLKDWSPEGPHHYCLDCLLMTVTEWVEVMKTRGPSNITPDRILTPQVKGGTFGSD